ncbi:L-lysine 2,3-aminomutase [invertebrate metagenome]|uniref:L-lysine 2,3-aminomutase n=1 Tax=invertebrate metagenome TaxID=1711999 RepID=A0A2H9T451_9ZZZZ
MIASNPLYLHTHDSLGWQKTLANCLTQPEQLLQRLELDLSALSEIKKAHSDFKLLVPEPYLKRIKKGDPDDPLLKQILPTGQELSQTPGFTRDPLNEGEYNPFEGIIHKYKGRLLLITSGACAVNCRFCFRRHFPYQNNQLGGAKLDKALSYIAKDTSIREVILSGGDPLAASDNRLQRLTTSLAAISHVQILRIHSRLPIVIPQRITDEMIHWFTSTRLSPVLVIHCNHPQEIDQQVANSLNQLHRAGVTLLNQSTLLKGVNDSAEVLIRLSHKLFEHHVLPYYLHQLDHVQGAAHFEVSDTKALKLMHAVMANCSGYLVPKLVRELDGYPNKIPLSA